MSQGVQSAQTEHEQVHQREATDHLEYSCSEKTQRSTLSFSRISLKPCGERIKCRGLRSRDRTCLGGECRLLRVRSRCSQGIVSQLAIARLDLLIRIEWVHRVELLLELFRQGYLGFPF